MRTMRFSLLALILMNGCVTPMQKTEPAPISQEAKSAPEWSRGLLVGKWRSERKEKDGGNTVETDEMFADGSYIFHFKTTYADDTYKEFAEFGEWGLVKDIHFTIQRGHTLNGEDVQSPKGAAQNYMAYKVLRLTDEEFVYQDISGSSVYEAKRLSSQDVLVKVTD